MKFWLSCVYRFNGKYIFHMSLILTCVSNPSKKLWRIVIKCMHLPSLCGLEFDTTECDIHLMMLAYNKMLFTRESRCNTHAIATRNLLYTERIYLWLKLRKGWQAAIDIFAIIEGRTHTFEPKHRLIVASLTWMILSNELLIFLGSIKIPKTN